jgi:hypothetical protein
MYLLVFIIDIYPSKIQVETLRNIRLHLLLLTVFYLTKTQIDKLLVLILKHKTLPILRPSFK